MPIWLTRKLEVTEWGTLQFRASMIQSDVGTRLYFAFLVKRRPLGEPDDVFILLPNDEMISRFPGFTRTTANDLPNGIRMLLGSEAAFARRCFLLLPQSWKRRPLDKPLWLSTWHARRPPARFKAHSKRHAFDVRAQII